MGESKQEVYERVLRNANIYERCSFTSATEHSPVTIPITDLDIRDLMKDRVAGIFYLSTHFTNLYGNPVHFSLDDARHFSHMYIQGLPLMTDDMIPKGKSRRDIEANWMDEIFPFHRFDPNFVTDLEACLNMEKTIPIRFVIHGFTRHRG